MRKARTYYDLREQVLESLDKGPLALLFISVFTGQSIERCGRVLATLIRQGKVIIIEDHGSLAYRKV